MVSTEHIISAIPLVIRRRVKFGDCDPAGVVYTVTFGEYVISAAESSTARYSAPRHSGRRTGSA